MKIGLMGVSIINANNGVKALAYSAIYLLCQVAKTQKLDMEIQLFDGDGQDYNQKLTEVLEIIDCKEIIVNSISLGSYRKKSKRKIINHAIKSCDYIFDFTGGDSFADIYGQKRFLYYTFFKYLAIKKSKLIIAPQTIGPFNKSFNAFIAKYILKRVADVMARDSQSAQYLNELCGINIEALTDVAFFLPFDRTKYKLDSSKKKIGINVSGLLWNGGYTQNNQFGLKLNYKDFIRRLIGFLHENDYEVYLIPHVLTANRQDYDSVENDAKVNDILKEEFPFINLAPLFENPVDAKSYICQTDVFIGSRMHATIAALSAGVITIPVSYSRKFEGLFHTIGYEIGVDGRQLSTDEALEKVESYLSDVDSVATQVKQAKELIEIKKNEMLTKFCAIIDQ